MVTAFALENRTEGQKDSQQNSTVNYETPHLIQSNVAVKSGQDVARIRSRLYG